MIHALGIIIIFNKLVQYIQMNEHDLRIIIDVILIR